MAKNKDTTPTESQQLEARVDAMMNPDNQADATTTPPPLDIFADQPDSDIPGAPVLPSTTPESVAVTPPDEPKSQPVVAAEPASQATIVIPEAAIDTPESDAAIDDIVAQEADQVLAAEDAGIRAAYDEAESRLPVAPHGHPVFWFMICLMVIIIIAVAVVLLDPNINLPV